MAQQSITTLTGTVQKYFTKAFMDMPQEDFRTPLADSNLLEPATIPPNSGTYAEFRTFDHFDIDTLTSIDGSGGDTPKTYSENAEPTNPSALSTSVKQVSFEMVADWFHLGNVQVATDPIDLMMKTKEELKIKIRRTIHQLTNDRFVRAITANVLNSAQSPSPLPAPFKTIYGSQAPSYAALTADSVLTPADIKRGVMALRNSHVPGIKGNKYACVIDEAGWQQLQEDDEFKDQIKRIEDLSKKVFMAGDYIDWGGVMFVLQDDAYRCGLPLGGGVLATRNNSGAVHVCTLLGKNAAGYVDFGKPGSVQRRTLDPKFHVIDTSKTGIGPTVGYRLAYQACVLNQNRGLNIAYTSRYDESVADL